MKFIDGHNDTVIKIKEQGVKKFLQGEMESHLDLSRAYQSGFAGGFFAIYCPNRTNFPEIKDYESNDGYQLPLSEPCDHHYAQQYTSQMIDLLTRTEQESNGKFKIVQNTGDLQKCLHNGDMAAILHIEGAESIDPDFKALHDYYNKGLRSLGPVWSRANIFGEGVPFHFPSSPDTGPGLTVKGRQLVKECNRLGIMIDQSHLNEKGFWDIAKLTDVPLVATHSNVHALCPISRNLTNKQIDAIGESNGVIGVTYSLNMLRRDGKIDPSVSLTEITKHILYIADRIGVEHVALGSDFDGTTVPDVMQDVRGVPKLLEQLLKEGLNERDLNKITKDNWLRVLKDTWRR
ncbi:dipeptidase [Halobacillus sp. BBL2006]|uniref:dipeptidase n=1 Tax=Halobacillus sp. BBL2006 TaxID=1543706 RepID=UPI0005442D80|nr:dipeptidase [Halobacillus sp. BBL2006]KHE73210.1 peptidase [Halobacillus sp. BBL2006]